MSMISPEAIKKYVQRRSDDLKACKQAVEAKDYAIIENIGHKLKGNGLTFGYPELADLGKDMESAAMEKDMGVIETKVNSFEKWFNDKADLIAESPAPPQP